MRYLASEIYALLAEHGCTYEGDRDSDTDALVNGWLTQSCQPFTIPEPDKIDGMHWFDADVIDDIFRDRWLGFTVPSSVKRYP